MLLCCTHIAPCTLLLYYLACLNLAWLALPCLAARSLELIATTHTLTLTRIPDTHGCAHTPTLQVALEVVEALDGMAFARTKEWGYVTSCPTNIGACCVIS